MKIICISDTHLQHDFKVPDGDVLIHAGDGTWRGDFAEITKWAAWLGAFPHKHKIAIAGNHDWGFQREPAVARELIERHGITYLEDSGTTIGSLKIWGSPWQPEFSGWAFNLSRFEGELGRKWAMIPDDTQVLITHGPPKDIQDLTAGYDGEPPEHVECWDMRERVKQLKDLRLHVFGHIHAAYGVMESGQTKFVNASICNEQYKPVNPPIEVNL